MLKEIKKNQKEKVLAKLKENLTEKEVRQLLFIVFLLFVIPVLSLVVFIGTCLVSPIWDVLCFGGASYFIGLAYLFYIKGEVLAEKLRKITKELEEQC